MSWSNIFFIVFVILGSVGCQSNRKNNLKNNSSTITKLENKKGSSKDVLFPKYSNSQDIEEPADFVIQPMKEKTNATDKERNRGRNCYSGQSLYSITDLKEIINYIVDSKLKTIETINSSYYSLATAVRDKYTKRLEEFQKKVEARPEHLKHILQDVAKARGDIENISEKLASELEDYHENKHIYENKIDRANKTLKNIYKINQLCKLSCEDEYLLENRHIQGSNIKKLKLENKAMVNDDRNYCSEFEEIRRTVTDNFLDFQHTYTQALQKKIDHDDKEYEGKIENLIKKLKEAAVKSFGFTMYDILSLQDECHHLLEELVTNNVSKALSYIQKSSYLIEIKLTDLKDKFESYKEYCMNCKKISFVHRRRRQTLPKNEGSVLLKHVDTENSIESLINNKLVEITNSIDDDYGAIFDELNEKINNTEFIEIFLAGLTPIRDEIANLTQIETERFDGLKGRISKSSFDDIMRLESTFAQLLETLSNDDLLHVSQ